MTTETPNGKPEAKPEAPRRLHALVVEDSPPMRKMIVFALSRLKGLVVAEADDGVDALRRLAGTKFDLIITDINMPILDGVDALRRLASTKFDLIITDINMPILDGLKLVKRLRADEAYMHVPIIIITTEGAAEDRQRALALGANAYITKPIQAPQVIKLVKETLGIVDG